MSTALSNFEAPFGAPFGATFEVHSKDGLWDSPVVVARAFVGRKGEEEVVTEEQKGCGGSTQFDGLDGWPFNP